MAANSMTAVCVDDGFPVAVCVVDQCDALVMQNWEHVKEIFAVLNALPSKVGPASASLAGCVLGLLCIYVLVLDSFPLPVTVSMSVSLSLCAASRHRLFTSSVS